LFFDTHAHYDDKRFNDDREEVLDAMQQAGITLILNAASSLRSAKFSLELADKYTFIYASVGVHPHDAKSMSDNTIEELEKLLTHEKALAVGEIGLDYHYDFSPRDVQKKRFYEQLELARRIKKPVIVHEREALTDTLAAIKEYRDLKGVVHCSGLDQTSSQYVSMLSWPDLIHERPARSSLEDGHGIDSTWFQLVTNHLSRAKGQYRAISEYRFS